MPIIADARVPITRGASVGAAGERPVEMAGLFFEYMWLLSRSGSMRPTIRLSATIESFSFPALPFSTLL
jgi:hypothetical protein